MLENVVDVGVHMIRFDVELDKLHAKQGYNSQLFTKDKLEIIMTSIENYEKITWPVIYLDSRIFNKCRLLKYACLAVNMQDTKDIPG